jgi:spore coat polysaccharide biosynthesis predicted glycosyltransferase SpsG
VLEVLLQCNLPDDARITVVMGAQAPALERVRALAAALPWQTDVRVNVSDMAALMADADLAIGAGGMTSIERIAMALPSITVPIAYNQRQFASAIEKAGLSKTATINDLPIEINRIDHLYDLQRRPLQSISLDWLGGTDEIMCVIKS